MAIVFVRPMPGKIPKYSRTVSTTTRADFPRFWPKGAVTRRSGVGQGVVWLAKVLDPELKAVVSGNRNADF